MSEKGKHRLSTTKFERIYKIGVAIKGFDGIVEFIVGVLLVTAPGLLHLILRAGIGEAAEHTSRTASFIAQYIARVDGSLAKSSTVFLAIFLISHGLVKIVLAYCLLKEILWIYPYALIVLVGFLVYQVYLTILSPTIGTVLFCLLDLIIIALVWDEWRRLKHPVKSTELDVSGDADAK